MVLLRDRKAEQGDMALVQQVLQGLDIAAAVDKMQNYVVGKVEEGSKERRALEYRMKEALAGVESILSAKLTDISLDPIREGQRTLQVSLQDLEKRLNQAFLSIESIDLTGVSQAFSQQLEELSNYLQALSVDIAELRAESSARKASELVSTRALCLACGSKSTSKAPGLLGADHKLYKGDFQHNRGNSSEKTRRQSGTRSELFSEWEKEGENRHKPSLSLAIEPLQVSETPWKRSQPRHSTPLATGPLSLYTPHSSTHRNSTDLTIGPLRRRK